MSAAPDLTVRRLRALRTGRPHRRALFLPPSSPDLNAIEMAFAKRKALLRKAGARSIAAVWHRIGALLDRFKPPEGADCFPHVGQDRI